MTKHEFACTLCSKTISADEDRVFQIVESEYDCQYCNGRQFKPISNHKFTLKCGCGYSTDAKFSEIDSLLSDGCPDAHPDIEAPSNIKYHHITLSESNYFLYSQYLWTTRRKDADKMLTIGRSDFWEYLIHFTSLRKINSIYNSGTIEPKQTGYFGRQKGYGGKSQSVCLTEAPATASSAFFDKFGKVGIVFKKIDLIKLGAQPIIHLSDDLIKAQIKSKGFNDSLIPFVQLYRPSKQKKLKPYDFVFEREWRVPSSILFSQVQPVGLILKNNIGSSFYPDRKNWMALIKLTMSYGEIVIEKNTQY